MFSIQFPWMIVISSLFNLSIKFLDFLSEDLLESVIHLLGLLGLKQNIVYLRFPTYLAQAK